MLCFDLLNASRASAIPHVALRTLEMAYSALLSTPTSWALARSAHRIWRAKFAGQFAFVAAHRTPVAHTVACFAVFHGDTIDADKTTHMTITPLPP